MNAKTVKTIALVRGQRRTWRRSEITSRKQAAARRRAAEDRERRVRAAIFMTRACASVVEAVMTRSRWAALADALPAQTGTGPWISRRSRKVHEMFLIGHEAQMRPPDDHHLAGPGRKISLFKL
jgi:hypothetical protein